MAVAVQFSVIDDGEGGRLGKLDVPNRKVADWINFLVSPRQQVHIISAESRRGGLTICFQASDVLYAYLDKKLSRSTKTGTTQSVHQTLEAVVAS
ncbi:MAG: hypothetical protein KME16_08105 [Scytolyngbya sp. HA4215-MV1]|jgi:hypothetical protein|nr:hypothetical protein [Scytolyngbya sp. HA4215-MV1]